MVLEVFPTFNDIGGSGAGRIGTEENFVESMTVNQGLSTVLSGMEPSDGGGLTVTIAAGRCYAGGYLVTLPSSEDVTVSDDTTGYLWLQLTGADSYAVSATAWIETADLTSPPANAALITKFVTSGGSVSSVQDRERREGAGSIGGTYTGDGGADEHQEIDLGLTPRFVIARTKAATVNAQWRWSLSNIFPGNTAWPDFDADKPGIFFLCTRFDESGVDDAMWEDRANEDGPGLGIIPNGFKAYNRSSSGLGMNDDGYEYVYLAWF